MELFDLTMLEAADYAIARIMEEFGFNKSTAKELFKNAITYNTVIEEIVNQVEYIIDSQK